MFIGHFGAGLALKRAAPSVSLGTLFFGAQFVDLLWPVLLQSGLERAEISPGLAGPPIAFTHYPYSHSLAMACFWAALLGGAHYLSRKRKADSAVVAMAVLSHWALDFFVHHPDLPLAPGLDGGVGLGWWSSTPLSLSLELGLFFLGVWAYLRATVATDRTGNWGFWALMIFLLLIQIGNTLGEPPPSISAVAWVGHAQWLLVLWGWWVDRHRRARTG